MNKFALACVVALLAAVGSAAWADSLGSFIADSNQFGYQGTVQNTTKDTGSVAFPTPRDSVVYFVNNAPVTGPLGDYGYYGNYNEILTNWYQTTTGNQNPGFFQIGEIGDATVNSATGGWTQENSGLWDFTLTVTGTNANYANSMARLWQPDINDAAGGTFTNYTYTLTATGMTTAVTDGWRYNTIDPTTITGSLGATFQLTYAGDSHPDGNPGAGAWDTYSVNIAFSDASWVRDDWSDQYTDASGTYYYGLGSTFAAPVPEPITMMGVLLGIGALGRYWSRKRNSA